MIDTPGHMWFLPAFFVATVLFHVIEIVAKGRKIHELLFLVLCLLFAWLTSCEFNISFNIMSYTISLTDVGCFRKDHLVVGFPFGFNIAFMGVSLMILGKVFRDNTMHIDFSKWRINLPITIVCLVIGFMCYYFNKQPEGLFYQMKCNMSFAEYGYFGLFLGSSIFLGVTLLLLSHLLNNLFFARIGSLSLIVYLIHPLFISIMKTTFSLFGFNLTRIPFGGDIFGVIVFILTVITTLAYVKMKYKFQVV